MNSMANAQSEKISSPDAATDCITVLDDTIQSIGGRSSPEFDGLEVEVASMTAFDYIFLTNPESQQQPISDQHALSLAFQLLEKLELNPERATFVAIQLDDHDNIHYTRYELQWVEQFPVELKRTPIINAQHIHFIETLREHSHSASSYLL